MPKSSHLFVWSADPWSTLWLRAVGAVVLGLLLPTAVFANPTVQDQAALKTLSKQFTQAVRPILRRYCVDCHSAADPSGGITLEGFQQPESIFQAVRTWQKVARTQQHQQMPPAELDQPDSHQRQTLISFGHSVAAVLDQVEPFDPGPVVFRRLTRRQYGNSIEDLFGIQFDVAAAVGLPADPTAFGYDSIGSTLEIPPLLMEKYVAAADEVLDRVILNQPTVIAHRFDKLKFQLQGTMPEGPGKDGPIPPATEVDHGTRLFRVNAKVPLPISLTQPGYYRLKIRGWGHKGPKWIQWQPNLGVQLSGTIRKSLSLLGTKQKPSTTSTLLDLPAGEVELSLLFLNAVHGPRWVNNKDRFRLVGLTSLELTGPVSPSGVEADPKAHQRLFSLKLVDANRPEEADKAQPLTARQRAERIIWRLARRAFRRPVSQEEVDRLLRLFDLAQRRNLSFEQSVRLMVKATLISPHFLFRIEGNAESADQFAVDRISDDELATRLSYFLWGTMPDEELLQQAAAGRLSDPNVLRQQVKRMLDSSRENALVDDFAVQWLHLQELETALPSEEFFSDFTARARASMRREVLMFWQNLIRDNRSLLELIDSDYTYTNRDLWKIYQFGSWEDEFHRQSIDKRHHPERGGLLGMGAVLAMTSHVARNSPTRRGKWVLDVMLGDPPPPPPANVEQIDESGDKAQAKSFRELLAIHADESSSCAGCHRKMDPLGFALDNFNPIGRWQRARDGQPIDATGVLPDGRKVRGVVQLKELLMDQKDQFARNLIEQMLIYALGRELSYRDRPTVARILKRLQQNDYRMRELILGVVESYPFQYRRHPDAVLSLTALD